jgi:predicted nucleotidyltransferase
MKSLSPNQIALIKAIALKHGFSKVAVFGSVARGDDSESSDVDLLVDGQGHRGFSIGAFQNDAELALERKVDVVTRSSLHPAIRQIVLSELVELS